MDNYHQGYPQQGYPPQGYPNQQPYPPQGYPNQQPYPPQGYPQQQAYPPQQQAYPPQQGYPQQTNPNYTDQSSYSPPNYNQEASFIPSNTDEKFSSKTQFNDIWAAILFFVQLAGFVVLSVYMLKNLNFKDFKDSKNKGIGSYHSFIAIAGAGVVAGILSLLYIVLMQIAAKILIIVSFWFSVVLYLLGAVYFFTHKQYFPAVMLAIFGILYAFLWFSWRSRIPFAELMLKNVAKFTRNYPGTLLVGFIFMIISIGYIIFWSFTLTGAIQLYNGDKNCGPRDKNCKTNGALYGIYVFSIFSLFWTTQLIKDICHMTVSGAFAADYFFPSTTSAASKFSSFSSLGRALTTSFGSACFGSLLVAILQVLKTLAREARQDSDNLFLSILACCAECILAQLEEMVKFFNRYAYCYCAMYGLPYIQAGKATWNLIKDRGVEAIINDSLVGNVLTLGSVFISAIGAIVAFLLAKYLGKFDTTPLIIIVVIGFIISLLVNSIVSSVIESANTAFFVCLAEDPQALASYNPELFEKIRQTYPEVVQPV